MKLGLLSTRRNPVLSALMVVAIATGIGACMTIVNIEYVMTGNPIPHRSDVLFHVQVDGGDPFEAAVDPVKELASTGGESDQFCRCCFQ